jgi:hypothetical protein
MKHGTDPGPEKKDEGKNERAINHREQRKVEKAINYGPQMETDRRLQTADHETIAHLGGQPSVVRRRPE